MKIPRNDHESSRVVGNDPYALAFLKAVKLAFQNKKDNYNEILKVLRDLKSGRIYTRGVATRVEELLKGHIDLMLGFNIFLLKENKTTLSLVFKDTSALCNAIKFALQNKSGNCSWVTHSTITNSGKVVDVVVLHNIIYVVTNRANIGALSLNSLNIKFLKLKSTPNKFNSNYSLVNCDEQLLVIDFLVFSNSLEEIHYIYKVDFSTMTYVKLKTLGDIALFYASNFFMRKWYALSNPNRWGYESNFVYAINRVSTLCSVYSGDAKKLRKCIRLPAPRDPHGTSTRRLDWCFRHPKYEIDYLLVE